MTLCTESNAHMHAVVPTTSSLARSRALFTTNKTKLPPGKSGRLRRSVARLLCAITATTNVATTTTTDVAVDFECSARTRENERHRHRRRFRRCRRRANCQTPKYERKCVLRQHAICVYNATYQFAFILPTSIGTVGAGREGDSSASTQREIDSKWH